MGGKIPGDGIDLRAQPVFNTIDLVVQRPEQERRLLMLGVRFVANFANLLVQHPVTLDDKVQLVLEILCHDANMDLEAFSRGIKLFGQRPDVMAEHRLDLSHVFSVHIPPWFFACIGFLCALCGVKRQSPKPVLAPRRKARKEVLRL
jgi:hypothetical protein